MISQYLNRLMSKLFAREIVNAAYIGILGRHADKIGLELYSKQIAKHGNLAAVFGDIATSSEAREKRFSEHQKFTPSSASDRSHAVNANRIAQRRTVMKELTVEELCATAEDYFRTLANPLWQMAKPFSSGQHAPAAFKNIGYLLAHLYLSKGMTVLDFGSGCCWFSRFLYQMGYKVISCDVSKTALETGRRLFSEYPIIGENPSEPMFLLFDGHHIDLPDESVDRIICFDSFHHVPNQEEVISEFARVIKKGGIAGFNEPGLFHSQTPVSRSEMEKYNVLENDIDVNEIFSIASGKGFAEIKLQMLCDRIVSLQEYNLLLNKTPSEEMQSQTFNHIFNKAIDQSIFYLYKGPFIPDSSCGIGLSHHIAVDGDKEDLQTSKGEEFALSLKIVNNGSAQWLHENTDMFGVVKIGTHLYDEFGGLINYDFTRHSFPRNVMPQETVCTTIVLKMMGSGKYKIVIDLVSENVSWFENYGSRPIVISVTVH